MTPLQFSEWITSNTPSLKAWGNFVVKTITEKVRGEIGGDRYSCFFKILPSYRVKDVDSALKKLEKKKYQEPIRQMTDLVGCRFVVLLSSDIGIVEKCLVDYAGWTTSRERHYLDEIVDKPGEFDYQSVHYLVTCPDNFTDNGIAISEGTVCEVQIRSVLQHAYAELVHDNIYKPEGYVPPAAKRLVARCMALMEATDEMFCAVVQELQSVNKNNTSWSMFLDAQYKSISGREIDSLNDADTLTILDVYRELLTEVKQQDVADMIAAPVYRKQIETRVDDGLFHRPICILVFWLAKNRFDDLKNWWPLQSYQNDVADICAAVGVRWN